MPNRTGFLIYKTINNKDLLTECEVCTGKYCLRFFVHTFLCDKNQRQYFPPQTDQTRLIRDLLYGFVTKWITVCSNVVEKTRKHFRC